MGRTGPGEFDIRLATKETAASRLFGDAGMEKRSNEENGGNEEDFFVFLPETTFVFFVSSGAPFFDPGIAEHPVGL